MRGRERSGAAVAMLAVALCLAGCAETKGVTSTAKPITQLTPAPGYKIGNPYQVDGVWYYPAEDFNYSETGIASWYGDEFAGRPTASGEIFDPNQISAAHRTLPMPSIVRITNLDNGRALAVRVNDRGPFAHGRIIDVSRRTAQLLGFHAQGTAKVRVEILPEESRTVAAAAGRPEVKPAAAPASTVVAEVLPGSPQPVNPQPAPKATSSLELVKAPPIVDGRVFQLPVHPTQIYVQAGAFVRYDNARQLGAKLSSLGPAKVTAAQVGAQQFYRVRLGPIATVEEADMVLSRVISIGHPEARIVVD